MSDSASDRNVEDVLSSVRRLVSNELPRMPRPVAAKAPSALVLTEAHRISSASVSTLSKSSSLEDRIAELEAAVGARVDEWEPDGSEDQEMHRPKRIVYTRPPSEDEKVGKRKPLRLSQIALIETGPAHDEPTVATNSAGEMTFRHGSQHDDEKPDDRMIAEPPVSAEPETTPETEEAANLALVEDAAAPETAEEDDDIGDVEIVDIDDLAPHSEMSANATPDDFSVEVAADAVTSEVAGMLREITDETLAEAESFAASLEKAVADSLRPSVRTEARPDEPESERSKDEPEDALKSETDSGAFVATLEGTDADSLKQLVASLIRAELQGELGERITRNVRKLVRREIHRALTAREFE
jgi:hypothetical protein